MGSVPIYLRRMTFGPEPVVFSYTPSPAFLYLVMPSSFTRLSEVEYFPVTFTGLISRSQGWSQVGQRVSFGSAMR